MPLLLGRRKKFSWKLRPTEKGGKGDEGILVSRPGEIQVVEEGFRANVDIVYVHGLSPGRDSSQTQDTFSTSALSTENPNARILSWSYDTRAYSSGYRLEDALESHTNSLLEELATVRSQTETKRRPIVFIAHSLGGLLVKKALVKSCEAEIEEPGMSTVSMGIKQSTLGAVLLGPHEEPSKSENAGSLADKLTRLQNEEFKGLCKDVFVKNVPCPPLSPPLSAMHTPPRRPSNRFSIIRSKTSSSSSSDSSSHHSAEFPKEVLDEVNMLCTSSSIEQRHSAMQREDDKAQSPPLDKFEDHFNIGVVPKSAISIQGNRFIGRGSKVLELRDKLLPRDSPDGKIVVLHGPPGCGKTFLAREFCHQYEDSFSTIFWINANSIQSIQSSYATFAKALTSHYAAQSKPSDSLDSVYRHLGLNDPLNDKTREDGFEQIAGTPLIDAINLWFSQVSNTKWLMVLDNIDESDVTILADFFPTPVSGHILIITRLEGYVEKHGYEGVTLGNMTNAESKLLLLNLMDPKLLRDSDPKGDDSEILTAVDGCGHLPLAITQAASFMNTMRLNIPKYLQLTKDTGHEWSPDLWTGYNETRVDEILTAQQHATHDHLNIYSEPAVTTYAEWEHQLQEMADTDPKALDLLTLCSFFAKDEIPGALLREAITIYQLGESADRQLEHMLKDLTRRALITRHSCVPPRIPEDDSTSWVSGLSGRESPELLFPMVETSSAEFDMNVQPHQSNIIEKTDCISVHPLVHHWAQKRLNPVAQGHMAERAFRALALAIQSSKRPPSDLIGLEKFLPHLQACLESIDLVDGDPKVDVKWTILADVCRYQGFHQVARKFYKFSLKKIESELDRPSSRIEAARLRMTLGFVYIQQKRLAKAEEQYKKATAHINAANQNTKDPKDCAKFANLELKISASLASLYKIQNRFEEAEERYYSILPRFEQVWGSEDIRTLLLLEQFASCLLADGNYEESEALYRRVLVSYVNEFGREYPAVAKIQQKLAKTLQLQGCYEKAEGILQQALNTTEKRLGKEHPETVKILLFMAQLKCLSRKFEQAETIYLQISLFQMGVGSFWSAALLESTVNLGTMYQTQKKYTQAEKMYVKALEDLRKGRDRNMNMQHEKELMVKLKGLYEEMKVIGEERGERLLDEFVERFPDDGVSLAILAGRKRRV